MSFILNADAALESEYNTKRATSAVLAVDWASLSRLTPRLRDIVSALVIDRRTLRAGARGQHRRLCHVPLSSCGSRAGHERHGHRVAGRLAPLAAPRARRLRPGVILAPPRVEVGCSQYIGGCVGSPLLVSRRYSGSVTCLRHRLVSFSARKVTVGAVCSQAFVTACFTTSLRRMFSRLAFGVGEGPYPLTASRSDGRSPSPRDRRQIRRIGEERGQLPVEDAWW